jgi:hypothetical protein
MKIEQMKYLILFILSFILLQFTQCDRTLIISFDDIQIDTLKMHKIAKHKIVKGQLLSWSDTTKAFMTGQINYQVPSGKMVKKGDTILFLKSNDPVERPRQKWIDHSAVQSLNEKINLLRKTLERVEKLKSDKSAHISESDLEQVAVSLDHTGTQYTDLRENINYDEIIIGLRSKIKKLEGQSVKLKNKLKNNENSIGNIAIVTEHDGKLVYLTENEQCVKPGEPLYVVKAQNGKELVIKLDHVPNDELQFTANIKLNDKVLQLKLDGLEEHEGILKVADEVLDQLDDLQSIKLSFESEPLDKLLIKRSAIHKRGKRNYVFVKRENRFEAVKVKIGRSRGSKIEILDGLQPNDQIIVSSSKPIWRMRHLEIEK